LKYWKVGIKLIDRAENVFNSGMKSPDRSSCSSHDVSRNSINPTQTMSQSPKPITKNKLPQISRNTKLATQWSDNSRRSPAVNESRDTFGPCLGGDTSMITDDDEFNARAMSPYIRKTDLSVEDWRNHSSIERPREVATFGHQKYLELFKDRVEKSAKPEMDELEELNPIERYDKLIHMPLPKPKVGRCEVKNILDEIESQMGMH
jgi:hypothetical protein